MRLPGKDLEVKLLFNEPILSLSDTMCRCIIFHEVSVAISVKIHHCRVHVICQYIHVFYDCLFTLKKHQASTSMPVEHAPNHDTPSRSLHNASLAMSVKESHTPAASGIPTGKSPLKLDEVNTTELQLTRQLPYLVKEFGNQIIGTHYGRFG
ncbi:hypothetical protein TNCV_1543751 [Trichonephila clavipes]|nr:hypothetical protein TNCV_1543751 [Trichonephila clavipes]